MNAREYPLLATLLLPVLIASPGCATLGRSVTLGAASGGAVGIGMGAFADPGEDAQNRIRNLAIGTVIGSLIGAGAGFLLHQNVNADHSAIEEREKIEELKISPPLADPNASQQPKLLPPKTESKWVPDQVRGSTFIPGHYEYLIIEGAKWER